jgi:stress response protein YsnF
VNYEKIVTLYDTIGHAEAARHNLEVAGFPASEISLINSKTLGLVGEKLREPGLWHRLFGRDIQEYEATVYGRSVEAGGAVLTLRVPENDTARAMSILNAHQSVDLLKRAEQHGLLTAATGTMAKAPAIPVARTPEVGSAQEILALAEEKINVGKRVVQEGTTRIRRFVTEMPVEAQVTLHEEHVRVVRRAIADPNYLRNIDWADKTIEFTETAEEPVVTKSAHVTEEIVIEREGSDHVQTVHDKVRRQELEVEKIAGHEPVLQK